MSKDPHAKRYEMLRLIERSIEIARKSLADQGSFLPGYIAVTPNGKYHLGVSAQGGADGWNLLTKALQQKVAAEHLRAAAMYRDVRVRAKGASGDMDAIQVVAELASGASVNVFQVYRMADGEPLFEVDPEVEDVPSVVFAEAARSASGTRRWWEFWK